MKKMVIIIAASVLAASLCACDKEEEQTKFGSAVLEQMQKNEEDAGWENVDQNKPFGEYRSLEELIEIAESGELSEYMPTSPEPWDEVIYEAESDEETTAEAYSGSSTVVIFSEDIVLPEEGVTVWDWRSEMSEEDLAEYDALDPNDPQWQQYEDELNQEAAQIEQYQDMEVPNESDYQQQIEDAMSELENVDIPEEYMQYIPEEYLQYFP